MQLEAFTCSRNTVQLGQYLHISHDIDDLGATNQAPSRVDWKDVFI